MVNNMELADLLGGKMRYKNDPPTVVDALNEEGEGPAFKSILV